MVKWYFFLNKSNNSLLGRERITKGKLPICSEGNGNKEFASFRYLELYNYSLSLPDDRRCLFEIILGSRYQKPYFDIDIDLCDKESPYTRQQMIHIAEQLPDAIINSISKEFPQIDVDNSIAVFDSHSENKRSFHIIVFKWCVVNCEANRKFFEKAMLHVPTPWKRFIDKTMYKSVQYFRLYMSTKYGKGRIKNYNSTHSRWRPTSDNPVMETFLNSIVSYTEDCNLIPFDEDVERFPTFEKAEISAEDEAKVAKVISTMPYASCFCISEFKDGFVVMRRLMPSYCSVCEKVHENENPFAYVSMSGNVYVSCRRTDKSSLIGNINDAVIVSENKPERKTVKVGFFDAEKNTGQLSPTTVALSPSLCETPTPKKEPRIEKPPEKKSLTDRVQRIKQQSMLERLSQLSGLDEISNLPANRLEKQYSAIENCRIRKR